MPDRTLDWNDVFDVLVEECGAAEMLRGRFLDMQKTDPLGEWRFGGVFGFGGKLHYRGDELRVSCYREDETPKKLEALSRANARLAEILARQG